MNELIKLRFLFLQVSKGNDWPVVFFREIDITQPDFMKLSLFDVVVGFAGFFFLISFQFSIHLRNSLIAIIFRPFKKMSFINFKILKPF